MQLKDGKEAVPLCDQRRHGSFVNRTIVLFKRFPQTHIVLIFNINLDLTA